MVIDHHTICPIATYSPKHLNKVKSYFKHNGCVAGKKVRIVQDISIPCNNVTGICILCPGDSSFVNITRPHPTFGIKCQTLDAVIYIPSPIEEAPY